MIRHGLALTSVLVAASVAGAWNDLGHMVVARLAWQDLTAAERAKVVGYLKSHPHAVEFLKARRPENIPEDEWVFLRAATWADWVRSHHAKEFNVGERHYINYPVKAPGSSVAAPEPDEKAENVVSGITNQFKVATAGGDQATRAVAITWLFHLVGDIHQPLHAVALFSDTFPQGDRGGNLSTVRIAGGGVVRLHSFWDGLLGSTVSRAETLKGALEVSKLGDGDQGLAKELSDHTTPASWAKESAAVATAVVYRNGELKPANTTTRPKDADIPTTPDDYGAKAGEAARRRVYSAGKRLAEVLRQVIQANDKG